MADRPLRFCMITTFYPPYSFGGDGIYVRRLSNELARRGHQVEVIHCIDSYRLLARREPAQTYKDHPNVTVHGLRSRFGFLSPLATQQTGYPVFKSGRIQQILNKGFDVIHFHNISLVGGPGVLACGQGIKLYTMHEYWLICPTHVLFRFRREPCTKRTCLLCGLTYGRPPAWYRYSRLLPRMLKHVDGFITPSAFGRDMHHQMGLDIPFVHLPNFVPAAETEPPVVETVAGESLEQPYLLFVGRLEYLKGLHTLIPVFRRYRRARLLVAGDGSQEARLRQLAADSASIRFLGRMSGERMRGLYRDAVAVIVPSICYDMSPNVILEAFSEGTPVIVRNLGGMPEMVENSGGGFVYDTDDALVSTVDRLLADPALRDELGRRGRETLQREWSVDAHLARYMALIEEIGAERGKVTLR